MVGSPSHTHNSVHFTTVHMLHSQDTLALSTPCVFRGYNDEGRVVASVFMHVDDGYFSCENQLIYDEFIENLNKRFPYGVTYSEKDVSRFEYLSMIISLLLRSYFMDAKASFNVSYHLLADCKQPYNALSNSTTIVPSPSSSSFSLMN